MLTAAKLARFFIERERELFKFLKEHTLADDTPKPKPKLKPEPEPEPRKLRQSEMPGIDMNDLRRHCDQQRQRPPRAPGQQQRRFNGAWWYWG